MSAPVIHWFRQDLRLHDNSALFAAIASGRPVVPVYVFDDATPAPPAPGGASRWWLHQSLSELRSSLQALGSDLVLRRGSARNALKRLIADIGAETVFVTRCYEPDAAATERDLSGVLRERGVELRRFGGGLLFAPETITNKEGRPYRVFTPFYRACLDRLPAMSPAESPSAIPAPDRFPESDRLVDWGLAPTAPDWAGGLRETWTPGEQGAETRLDAFLDDTVVDYGTLRDRPDKSGTSMLSPHLHFGEISPRHCWRRTVLAAGIDDRGDDEGHTTFLRELIWREFSYERPLPLESGWVVKAPLGGSLDGRGQTSRYRKASSIGP